MLKDLFHGKVSAAKLDNVKTEITKSLVQNAMIVQDDSGRIKDMSTQINLCIERFPLHTVGNAIGKLMAMPTRHDVACLEEGHDLNDEIIAAILGVHLSSNATIESQRNTTIVEPYRA